MGWPPRLKPGNYALFEKLSARERAELRRLERVSARLLARDTSGQDDGASEPDDSAAITSLQDWAAGVIEDLSGRGRRAV